MRDFASPKDKARSSARMSGTSTIESLIDNEQIAIERGLLGPSEGARPRVGFEEAVDDLGLEASALGQALGGLLSRSAKGDRDSFGE